MDRYENFNEEFLIGMERLAAKTGLDERWELDKGKEFTFLYGGMEEIEDGEEPFHWEYAVTFRNKENPEDELWAYGLSEGSHSVDEGGFYEPDGLESLDSWRVCADGKEFDGDDRGAFPKGSDALKLRDAFAEWLDEWYEECYK